MPETSDNEPRLPREYRPVPVATIRTKLDGLDGPVTTQDIVDHLANNGASLDELGTIAALPDRRWADYNEALAATSSGFEPDQTARD